MSLGWGVTLMARRTANYEGFSKAFLAPSPMLIIIGKMLKQRDLAKSPCAGEDWDGELSSKCRILLEFPFCPNMLTIHYRFYTTLQLNEWILEKVWQHEVQCLHQSPALNVVGDKKTLIPLFYVCCSKVGLQGNFNVRCVLKISPVNIRHCSLG